MDFNSISAMPGRHFTEVDEKTKSITSAAIYNLLGGNDKTKTHGISLDNYRLAKAIYDLKVSGSYLYANNYGTLYNLIGSVGLNIAAFLVNGSLAHTIQTSRFEYSEAE